MICLIFCRLALGLRGASVRRQQDRVIIGGDTELVVESMLPDLLHIIPVEDDTVLDGVLQS